MITMVVDNMYSGPILNNAHRGDVAEMIVLSALGPGWRSVGLGWHPWICNEEAGVNESEFRLDSVQLFSFGEKRNA